MTIEEIIKDKEALLSKLLEILEGREARATLNLDGIKFKIGKSAVKLNGKIEISFVPVEKKG